jgi:hypothetical protein
VNGQGSLRAAALAAFAAPLAQGCATATRGPAVPQHLETQAVVSGFPDGIRYFPSNANDLALLDKDWVESVERDRAHRRAQGLTGPRPPGAYLAISGGGDPHTAEFDPSYMKQLFQFAYGMAEPGYPWAKRPPVLVSGEEDEENRTSQSDP